MKKQIFTFIILICTVFSLSAQESEYMEKSKSRHSDGYGKRVSIGVDFGPAIDWLQPKSLDYNKGNIACAFRVGVPIDINFTKANNYYFSTGLFFHYNAGSLNYKNFSIIDSLSMISDIHRKYHAYYLTIPTGIKLKTPDFNNFVIAANFGLYHSFLLSSNYKEKVQVEAFDQLVEIDPSRVRREEINPLGIREAVYAGLGLEYVIRGDFRAHFYVNFSHTFTNFFNGKKSFNEYYGEKEVAKFNSVEFIFGLNF